MCCGQFLAKYILFFFNLVFTLSGIGLIGIGITVLVHTGGGIVNLIPVNISIIPISVIVLGAIIFFIAFFGCCGAIRESRCLLILYAICMLILAGLKMWLAVVIFKNLNDLQTTVEGWLNTAFNNPALTSAFELLEVTFRCCGTTGPGSYAPNAIPASCCANPVNGACLDDGDIFRGCNDRFGSYFESFGEAIGIVLIIIIAIELIAVLLAFFLNHSITNKRKYKA